MDTLRDRCINTLDAFNQEFCKLIQSHYLTWVNHPDSRPTLTCDLIDRVFVPVFHSFVKGNQRNIYLIIFDGMRYDLWKELKPLVEECFNNRLMLHREECALSILPSATQYTRKAIFAGAFPADWKRRSNNIDPEISEIRLFKEALDKRNIPYADRLPDDLVTGGESEMKEEVLHALIEDNEVVPKVKTKNRENQGGWLTRQLCSKCTCAGTREPSA